MFREEFLPEIKGLLPNDKSLNSFQDSCPLILNSLCSIDDKMCTCKSRAFHKQRVTKSWMIRTKLRNNFLEAELFARCLLLVTICSLLDTTCSLLVNFCLLLVSFCSLLITFRSLLVTFVLLLVTFYSLLVTFFSKLL